MKKIWTLAFALVAATCLANGAEYVISNTPVAPVREEPSHAAEQATQLLFGDLCEIVESKSGWTKIRATKDGQVGWVTTSMMTAVSEEDVRQLEENRKANGEGVVAIPMTVATNKKTGEKLMLTIGTLAYLDKLNVPGVLIAAFLAALGSVFYQPAANTLILDIIPHDELVRGQSIFSGAASLINMVGTAISLVPMVYLCFHTRTREFVISH